MMRFKFVVVVLALLIFTSNVGAAEITQVVANLWEVGSKAFQDYTKYALTEPPFKGVLMVIREGWVNGKLHPLLTNLVCLANNFISISFVGYACEVMKGDTSKSFPSHRSKRSVNPECLDGWVLLTLENSTKCVSIFNTEPLNFNEAEELCKRQDAMLGKVEEETSKLFLYSMTLMNINLKNIWIGLKGNGTHFDWTSDGKSNQQPSWSPGYPSNNYGKTCVYQTRQNGWENAECEKRVATGVFCERNFM